LPLDTTSIVRLSIPISSPNITDWGLTAGVRNDFNHYTYTLNVPPLSSVKAKFSWNICWYSQSASNQYPNSYYAYGNYPSAGGDNWKPYQLINGCKSSVISIVDHNFPGTYTQSPNLLQFQPYTNGAGYLKPIVNQVIYCGNLTAEMVNTTRSYQPFTFVRKCGVYASGPACSFFHNVRTPFSLWGCFTTNPMTIVSTCGNVQSTTDNFTNMDVIPGVEIL